MTCYIPAARYATLQAFQAATFNDLQGTTAMPIPVEAYDEATQLAKLSDDDLYLLVANELKSEAFYADNRDDPQKISDTKAWFLSVRKKLRSIICTPALASLHEEPKTRLETILLICVIGDAISGVELGVSPFSAAALTVSYGLKNLCKQ